MPGSRIFPTGFIKGHSTPKDPQCLQCKEVTLHEPRDEAVKEGKCTEPPSQVIIASILHFSAMTEGHTLSFVESLFLLSTFFFGLGFAFFIFVTGFGLSYVIVSALRAGQM